MLRWACRAVVLFLPACFHPSYDHPACGPDGACPSGFTCSAQGFCELPGAGPGNDAGIDTPGGGGPFCYGAAPFSVCFATAPTGTIDVAMPTTFDTDTGTDMGLGTPLTCATPLSGGTGYCVVAASTITISSMLRAVGTKPLVLVAADSIDVPDTIDVSSHHLLGGGGDSIGAGADPTTGCNPGTSPDNDSSGGAAGGSFLGPGGNGGGVVGTGGTHGAAPGFGTTLRGGCPGQDGGGGVGKGGHGGGAVFLIAGQSITVGGTINAGGEGGAGGIGANDGGGGGGAGGLIGFDAMTITVTGTLIANGGGGGGGSSTLAKNGNPGGDANSTNSAPGGSGGAGGGGITPGGDGGAGSAGVAAGPGVTPSDANGGGGGGGGAGLIKGPPASLGSNLSPPATP